MMASHIAHEFNNYMTPVLIYAELLENDDSISAENQETFHHVYEEKQQESTETGGFFACFEIGLDGGKEYL